MVKYHIAKNGPARCTATKRDCPVEGEHFENEGLAKREFERQMRAQYDEFETHSKEDQSRLASEQVAEIIDQTEGEWLENVPAEELRLGDVLPDGRVVFRVMKDGEPGLNVYMMDNNSEYPPGFGYHHFPALEYSVEPATPSTKFGKIFRPEEAEERWISSEGNELVEDVPIKNILPGDLTEDYRTIAEIGDPYDGKITIHYDNSEKEEWEDPYEPEQFPLNHHFKEIFFLFDR